MLAAATATEAKAATRSGLRPRAGAPCGSRPSVGNQASLRFLGRQAGDATGELPWDRRAAAPDVITIRKLALVKPQAVRKGRACCADCANDTSGKSCPAEAGAQQREIADAGAGRPDGGAAPQDAGTSPPDAGAPRPSPPPDAGAPRPSAPPDAGTPPADAGPACPAETITIGGAQCGARYGATAKYCLAGAANWWFKESVVNGPPPLCQPGSINQQTTPFQSPTGCVGDAIFDSNGPPATVAPCTDLTNQIVFAGPTQATVNQCQYAHAQLITVTAGATAGHGKVTTDAGGQSTFCNY
jgi:hypothetical protein